MPTTPFIPQGVGQFTGWESVTGASFAWQALDDSLDATHDGDTSYVVLPRWIPPSGQMSFPVFLMASGLNPTSITVRVAGKIESAAPEVEIGFARGGLTAFHGTTWTPGATHAATTRVFATNPLTSAAWALGDIIGLEVCLKSVLGAVGKTRVTLLNGSIDWYPTTGVGFFESGGDVLA